MSQSNPRVLISASQIQSRIKELGTQIAADYPEGDLCLIGILKGAFVFLSDLARAIERDNGRTARGIMEGHLRRGFDEWI